MFCHFLEIFVGVVFMPHSVHELRINFQSLLLLPIVNVITLSQIQAQLQFIVIF